MRDDRTNSGVSIGTILLVASLFVRELGNLVDVASAGEIRDTRCVVAGGGDVVRVDGADRDAAVEGD